MRALPALVAVFALSILGVWLHAQAPEWQWGTMIEGWNGELAGSATDADGNTCIVGYFLSHSASG